MLELNKTKEAFLESLIKDSLQEYDYEITELGVSGNELILRFKVEGNNFEMKMTEGK